MSLPYSDSPEKSLQSQVDSEATLNPIVDPFAKFRVRRKTIEWEVRLKHEFIITWAHILHHTAFVLYTVLEMFADWRPGANHGNTNGYISRRDMMRLTGLHKRHLDNALAELAGYGLITYSHDDPDERRKRGRALWIELHQDAQPPANAKRSFYSVEKSFPINCRIADVGPKGTKDLTPKGTKDLTPKGTKVLTPKGTKDHGPEGTKVYISNIYSSGTSIYDGSSSSSSYVSLKTTTTDPPPDPPKPDPTPPDPPQPETGTKVPAMPTPPAAVTESDILEVDRWVRYYAGTDREAIVTLIRECRKNNPVASALAISSAVQRKMAAVGVRLVDARDGTGRYFTEGQATRIQSVLGFLLVAVPKMFAR